MKTTRRRRRTWSNSSLERSCCSIGAYKRARMFVYKRQGRIAIPTYIDAAPFLSTSRLERSIDAILLTIRNISFEES